MKQRTKNMLSTIYLSVVVGIMTGCLGGAEDGDAGTPVDPTTDDGSLTVATAPVGVEGSFVAIEKSPAKIDANSLEVSWSEERESHLETLAIKQDLTSGRIALSFFYSDIGSATGSWLCMDTGFGGPSACDGVVIDRTVGVAKFTNQVLTGQSSVITLNGTLKFTPPSGGTTTPTPGPTPAPPIAIKGNNGALLSGVKIGKGTAAVSDLRKQITVTVLGSHPSFTVGTAFATRPGTSIDSAYIFLPVTNTGSQTLCFVKLGGITYRNAGNAVLSSNGLTFVRGSVGKLSTIFTDTCLAPGETGMAADIEANIYAAVTQMEFTLDSNVGTVNAPVASVIPQSYTLQPPTSIYAGSLSINALNVGAGRALVGEQSRFHTWFLLDDAEQPLAYGLTDTTSPSVIAATGTATITDDVWYDGPGGSKLRVFVDFEDTTLAASLRQTTGIARSASDVCPASLPADELMICRNESRNQRVESLKFTYDARVSTP